jgi:hypothetical protein
MNEMKKAITLFLIKQGFTPRICYTCANRSWEKHHRWYSPNGLGFFICNIHPEAIAVGDEDSCDGWRGKDLT